MTRKIGTAIIGGGAAGMFCAASLSAEHDVLILERGERLGRKLSATGNGQGNVTNAHMSAEHYFSSEAETKPRISRALTKYGEGEMLTFLEGLGGLFLPDERGRVYPAGRQASPAGSSPSPARSPQTAASAGAQRRKTVNGPSRCFSHCLWKQTDTISVCCEEAEKCPAAGQFGSGACAY